MLGTPKHRAYRNAPFQQQKKRIRKHLIVKLLRTIRLFHEREDILPQTPLVHFHPSGHLLILVGLGRDLIKMTTLILQASLALYTKIEKRQQLLPGPGKSREIVVQLRKPFFM